MIDLLARNNGLRCGFTLLWAVCLTPVAGATTYIVDQKHPAANDQNAGTSAMPLRTISAAAGRAEAGDLVLIRPGVYREWIALTRSGTKDRPITFQAEKAGTVVVSGADPLTEWVRAEGALPVYSVAWRHDFIINTSRSPEGKIVHQRSQGSDPPVGCAEQVIWDGLPLQQVLRQADLRPGAFFVDWERHRLFLWLPGGRDPNQAEVLAGTRSHLFSPLERDNRWSAARYITVRGLVFRHAANFAGRGGVRTDAGWRLEDCTIEGNSAQGVMAVGDDVQLLRVTAQDNGLSGIGGSGKNILLKDCVVRRNNRKGFPVGWDGGGGKFTRTDGLRIEGHTSYDNTGPGIWLDWDNRNYAITGCTVYGNYGLSGDWEGVGIFIEASGGGRVAGNTVYSNTGAGIALAESRGVTVEKNTLADNGEDLELRDMERPGHELRDCVVKNNRFAGWRSVAVGTSLGKWGRTSAADKRLILDGNVFDPPPRKPLYQWAGLELTALDDVRHKLALEKGGAIQRLPFNRPLVASRTRARRKALTIDNAVAKSQPGDEVTIPVNGRTSIHGDSVEVFDLSNRYLTLRLSSPQIKRAVEDKIPPYPVSEAILLRVRLNALKPATDMRATALAFVPNKDR